MANKDKHTDINVGNLDFQPMPKRFMVWDKIDKKFLNDPSKACTITPLGALITRPDTIICQSTNLFDKDGEEIFEGHIVRVGGETGVVQMMRGEWHIVGDDDIPLSVWKPSGIEIFGHILSNPGLLEEKDV